MSNGILQKADASGGFFSKVDTEGDWVQLNPKEIVLADMFPMFWYADGSGLWDKPFVGYNKLLMEFEHFSLELHRLLGNGKIRLTTDF